MTLQRRRREWGVLGQERRRRIACAHHGVCDEPAEEREVGRHAIDVGLGKSVGEEVERLRTRACVRDELRDQRVIAEADLVALLDPCIDPDGARRQLEVLDAAGLR